MSERPIAWVEDHAEAERRHGGERDSCLDRLTPESFEGRWRSNPHALAEACWESGWDSAVIAMRALMAGPERMRRAQAEVRQIFQQGGVQFTRDQGYASYGTLAQRIVRAADGEEEC